MCIAIPYGKDNNQNESRLWHKIRTTPLYLLTLGAVIELLLLVIFQVSINHFQWLADTLIFDPQKIILYRLLSGISGFLFFALAMWLYIKQQLSENIEYVYFGGYFFLTLYNSIFFYLALYLGQGFVISSVIIQCLLMLFAFKPLWWAFYWASAQNKKTGYLFNTLFLMLFAVQASFIFII